MNRQLIKKYERENCKPGISERRNFLSKLGRIFVGSTLLGVFMRNSVSAGNSSSVNTPASPLLGTYPYLASIGFFAGTSAPQGWHLCDGSLLSIAEYDALYSLIGTAYGGDGVSNFALPDLRGRVPMHAGQGSGYAFGQVTGTENFTLTTNQMPAHTHMQNGSQNIAVSDNPNGMLPAVNSEGAELYGNGNTVSLTPSAVSTSGGSQPHNNMQPYLAINCCICIVGMYPSQS